MTWLPLARYIPLRGKSGITAQIFSRLGTHPPGLASLRRNLRGHAACPPGGSSSTHLERPSPRHLADRSNRCLAESSGSVLRPKPANRPPVGFVAKPTNPTYKLRLLAATLHWLLFSTALAVLAPCEPHLIPSGHRVHRTKPTCLSIPRRPPWLRPFALVLHLHQRKPSRILHMQILSQESVHTTLSITHHKESDHPLVLGHTWSSISPLMSALTTHLEIIGLKENKRKKTRTPPSEHKAIEQARTKVTQRSKTPEIPTPQEEAKGLNTIGTRANHKAQNSGNTRSSPCTNAYSP